LGSGNRVINSNDCVNLNLAVRNNGCADETAISATLTTDTAGVTVTQGSSNYRSGHRCQRRGGVAKFQAKDGSGEDQSPVDLPGANKSDFDLRIFFFKKRPRRLTYPFFYRNLVFPKFTKLQLPNLQQLKK
jgi:hypothetical protein